MKYNTKECPFCHNQVRLTNYNRHITSCQNHPEKKCMQHVDHDDLFCKYCGKECKNKNSLAQHECRCKENPNRYTDNIGKNNGMYGKPSWNKGLTKETDNRVLESSIKISHALKGCLGRKLTDVEKYNLSLKAKERGFGGRFYHQGILYNGIMLDSSYEVAVAKSLDDNHIQWTRCKRFPYYYNNKLHYYTPDFYLPQYDVYLDPKNDYLINNINPHLGYSDADKIQSVCQQCGVTIIILNQDQLDWQSIKQIIDNLSI